MVSRFSSFFLDFLYGKYDPIETKVEQRKRANQKMVWDPLGKPDISQANANCKQLDYYAYNIKKNPNKLRSFNIVSAVVIGTIALFGLLNHIFLQFIFFIAVIAAIPMILINTAVRNLKIDLVKGEIAKQKEWIYDPSPDTAKGTALMYEFPDIFKTGCRRYVEDQFWGEKTINARTHQFYTGLYHYFEEYRDSKGNRHEREYMNYFFAINLKKKAHANFLLYPENAFSKIGNLFSKKEINVESSIFNKYFAFKYNGKKGEKALGIVQSLSPAVQAELVTLAKQYNGLSVLFKDYTVFFIFRNRLLNNVKTSINNGLEVDQEDVEFFTENLDRFISTSSNVAYYL